MKRIHAVAILPAALAAAALLSAAAADTGGAGDGPGAIPCLAAAQGDALLRSRHGEAPAGMGIADGGPLRGRLLLLYRSAGGESWTLALADPQRGLLCVLAAGQDWEVLEPPRPGEPA